MEITLLFVYNADSGIFNNIIDGIKKVTAPSTYQCRLCGLTYGFATMKGEWKMFIDSLEMPVKFLHRDEFKVKYGSNASCCPAAFLEDNEKLDVLIDKVEMNKLDSLNGLMHLVTAKLNERGIKTSDTPRPAH
jgi:hypothetical protein